MDPAVFEKEVIQAIEIEPGTSIRAAVSPETHKETDLVFSSRLDYASILPDYHDHEYVAFRGQEKPIFHVIAKIKPSWETRKVKGDDIKFLALGPDGVGIVWLYKDEYVEVVSV